MRYLMMVILAIGCAHEAARPRSTLDDVPAAARQTIRARAGSANVRVAREGGDRYEAAWYENGLEREIVVTSAGVVVEQETEVRAADVPAAVRATAVQSLGGGGAITYVLLGDGRYEAETVVDGKEREVTLTADGSVSHGDDDGGNDDDDEGDDDDDEGGDRD